MTCLMRVSEVLSGVDCIVVSPSAPLATDVASPFEVSDDHLHRALGNTNRRGDVAQSYIGVAGDDEKHPTMVGEEGPLLSHTRTLPREMQISPEDAHISRA